MMFKVKMLIILHLILVAVAYTAWLWLDYRIVAVLAVAHVVMLEILRGCPLSHAQFPDDKNKRFYEWWMGKLGVKFTSVRRRRMRIFMQYILPLIIIGLAVFVQLGIGFRPLIAL